MKNLVSVFVIIFSYFLGSAQTVTVQLTTQQTYFTMRGDFSRHIMLTDQGVAKSVKSELIGENKLVIDFKTNTMTLSGLSVWFEETVELSSLSETYGVITLYDETNHFEYVVDLNQKMVYRRSSSNGSTNLIAYQISSIIEN